MNLGFREISRALFRFSAVSLGQEKTENHCWTHVYLFLCCGCWKRMSCWKRCLWIIVREAFLFNKTTGRYFTFHNIYVSDKPSFLILIIRCVTLKKISVQQCNCWICPTLRHWCLFVCFSRTMILRKDYQYRIRILPYIQILLFFP